MGISKENLGIAIEELKLSNDSEYSSKADLENLFNITESISVAQKTVNTKNIKDLLDEEIIIPITTSVNSATAATTLVDITLNLKESIENYDFINFQLLIKSDERKFNFPIESINTKNIIYNDSNTQNDTDGSIILVQMGYPSGIPNSYGTIAIGVKGWFKSKTQFYIYQVTNPLGELYNKISISSIKGIKIDSIVIDPVEYVNTAQGI